MYTFFSFPHLDYKTADNLHMLYLYFIAKFMQSKYKLFDIYTKFLYFLL